MSVDWLIKLWDKGGVPLVMIVLVFLLLRFVGKRAIKAMDNMATAQTESMREIASAVHTSSAAHVIALGGLTDRVSRMEGKVDVIGQLAIQTAPHARSAAMQSAVEVFEQDETPIHPKIDPQLLVDRPLQPRTPAKTPTPPKGITTYSIPRAKTAKP